MRIAYITDTREIGGAERYLANLAQEAVASGHEALVLAPQQELVAWMARQAPGARAARAFDDSYHDARTPARRAGALLALLPGMARSLSSLAPDVVHVNNGGFPGSDLCRIALTAARLAGVDRRVMTVHSNPWPRERLANARVQAAADRLVWSSARAVVSPSEAVAEGLERRRGMPPGLGRTIYYGVARARHDPHTVAALRKRLAPDGELLVGMVSARAVAEKGYDVFVHALAAAGQGARGAVVGPPPGDLYARASAAGLHGRLAIEGPRANVGDYYAAFDVLAVPSTAEECMPLVILEAASVGTPTFASRLAGIPEAVADGLSGRLFDPRASEQLAALVRCAAHDRERARAMGRAAAERWLDRFQLDAMAQATFALYGRDTHAGHRRHAQPRAFHRGRQGRR
ncbi:MAG TPA: glycosyltransferase family 4 protein [Solirubrobacteraceae bacterium]|nr:glycosyltransferase family 4 protein [Solirubrobacteraceae bacterium]